MAPKFGFTSFKSLSDYDDTTAPTQGQSVVWDNVAQTYKPTNPSYLDLVNKPFIDAREYGVVGDGTDQGANIAAAIAALPSTGLGQWGTIIFPLGSILVNTKVSIPAGASITFMSYGGRLVNDDISYGAPGTTFYTTTNSLTMFEQDASAGSTNFHGCTFRNINFSATYGTTATGVTAVSLLNVDRYRFYDCSFQDCAIGINVDSTAATAGHDSAWHKFDACTFYHCTTGLNFVHTYGAHITSCDFLVPSGGVGAYVKNIGTSVTSNNVHFTGCKVDGGIGIKIQGSQCSISQTNFESCTSGVIFDAEGNTSYNASTRNTLMACGFDSCTTGITTATGADYNSLVYCNFAGNTTNISDNGTGTFTAGNT